MAQGASPSVFVAALTRSLKRRAKRHLSLRSVDDALVGALTVIQRSDSALRVNPHFHTLALDGVYVRGAEGALVFHPLPAPSAEEVAQVAAWTHAGIARVLERHGRSLEGADDTPHDGASEEPVLAACYAASASDVQLLGAAPGRKTDKLVRPVRVVPSADEPLAEVGGVNVHAKVAVSARDHPRRERLCRYLLRPPLVQDRLSLEPDGRVRLAFKAAWKDGTHAVLLDPLHLIARLCALVPPPRFHMLRYHGVLAAHSSVRAEVVPGREPPSPPAPLPLFEASEAPLAPPPPPSRHPWAWLLRHVFAVEVSICPVPRCGGRMRVVDIATTPDEVQRARSRAEDPRGTPRLARRLRWTEDAQHRQRRALHGRELGAPHALRRRRARPARQQRHRARDPRGCCRAQEPLRQQEPRRHRRRRDALHGPRDRKALRHRPRRVPRRSRNRRQRRPHADAVGVREVRLTRGQATRRRAPRPTGQGEE